MTSCTRCHVDVTSDSLRYNCYSCTRTLQLIPFCKECLRITHSSDEDYQHHHIVHLRVAKTASSWLIETSGIIDLTQGSFAFLVAEPSPYLHLQRSYFKEDGDPANFEDFVLEESQQEGLDLIQGISSNCLWDYMNQLKCDTTAE